MSLPKISIVTPSFNQGKFLEQTINSVLGQGYPNLEYIVIDGGSTDNSVEIIRKYEKSLSYWVSEPDRGQTQAINKGLKKATGDILAYLNSDDLYLPGALNKVAEFLSTHPDIGLVYGDCEIVDQEGRLITRRRELSFDYPMGCMIGFGIIIPQPSAFFTRRTFEKVGYFNEEFHNSMDSEYWFRIARMSKVTHVPQFFSQFRIHPASKTGMHLVHAATKYNDEARAVVRQAYQSLKISKIIPFERSAWFRKLYRLKRFVVRAILGYHFK